MKPSFISAFDASPTAPRGTRPLRASFWSAKCRRVGWAVGGFVLLSGASAPAQSLLIDQAFRNDAAPGWTFTGNAALTGGSQDTNGQGWLRLTSPVPAQTAFAYENAPVPFVHGLDVRVQYQTWGGTGGDGLTLGLFDANATPAAGAYGGSLGYAQSTGGTVIPGLLARGVRSNLQPAAAVTAGGLSGGIFGFGFDEFGDYSNPTEGRVGGPGSVPNAVSIRGPGDGTTNPANALGAPNYGYLAGAGSPYAIQTGTLGQTTRPTAPTDLRYTEFLIGTNQIAQGQVPVTVVLSDATTSQTVISSYDAYAALVAFYGSAAAIPQTFGLDFASSTESGTNYHEIRGLVVTSLEGVQGFAPVANGVSGVETFVNPGTGPWETGANWDSGTAPTSSQDAFVDNGGTAVLTSAGTANNLGIGAGSSGATGTVDVTGPGVLSLNAGLAVGANGTGTLNVLAGGQVSAIGVGNLGGAAGATGAVNVGGADSTMALSGNLYVGDAGTGTLSVTAGGTASNQCAFIANQPGSTGTATVGDPAPAAAATWNNNGGLAVGYKGTGTLNVYSNGAVTSHDTPDCVGLDIGVTSTANGTVNLLGGTLSTDTVVVGDGGPGTLAMTAGATLNAANRVTVGNNSGATGTLTLDGAGTALTTSQDLVIGGNGTGNMTLTAGATVSDVNGHLGNFETAVGTATVDGPGSVWNNSGNLYVGDGGDGTLTLQNGGTATANCLIIANVVVNEDLRAERLAGPLPRASIFGRSTGVVNVDGTASPVTLNLSGGILVGNAGDGTLNVNNATVTSHDTPGCLGLDVAVQPGSTGTVTLTGAVVSTDTVVIGDAGTGIVTMTDSTLNSATGVTVGNLGGSTGTLNVVGGDSALTTTANLTVGNAGTGTMTMTGGAKVSDVNGVVGAQSGGVGSVTVDGAGSVWTNYDAIRGEPGELTVGDGGTGTLTLENGGTAGAADLLIAGQSGSIGTVNVGGASGPTTLNLPGGIFVGIGGAGALNVNPGSAVTSVDGEGGPGLDVAVGAGSTGAVVLNGATLSTDTIVAGDAGFGQIYVSGGSTLTGTQTVQIGNQTSGIGLIQVDGTGSSLTTPGNVNVGNFGTGNLNVYNGTSASDAEGHVGLQAGSTGTVTVANAGSVWNNSGNLYVGDAGAGTLYLYDGGTATENCLIIGNSAGSTGIVQVGLYGTTATLSPRGGIQVGNFGNGTLIVNPGNTVTSVDTPDCLGLDVAVRPGSTGLVNVSGGGASLATDSIVVSDAGTGNLNVLGGATVTGTQTIQIGNQAGSNGQLAVDGAGSTVTTPGNLNVGNFGSGRLEITGGAVVSDAEGHTALQAGSIGGGDIVGAGSVWQNSGNVYVGDGGSTFFTLDGGGTLTANCLILGNQAGSAGTIYMAANGDASTLNPRGGILVGNAGNGNLTVFYGSTVTSVDAPGCLGLDVGVQAGSFGAVYLGQGASTLSTQTIVVGDAGGAYVAVYGGGTLTGTTTINLGNQRTGGGQLAVDGAGSSVTTPGDLNVGNFGGGYLLIANGGVVSDASGHVGLQPGSNGTAVIRDGSVWNNSGNLYVGDGGNGYLTLDSRGTATETCLIIGNQAGSTGTVSVGTENLATTLTPRGGIQVGNAGDGRLDVYAGSAVTSVDTPDCLGLDVAVQAGSSGDVFIHDSGSTLSTQTIVVGNAGSGFTVAFDGGALAGTTTINVGNQAGSTGDLIADAGTVTTPGNLNVGNFGTGELEIYDGGTVSNAEGHVGLQAGSTGTVIVDGAGSTWANSANLYVGDAGAGTLAITGGGVVSNAEGHVARQAGSTGAVTVDGAGSAWNSSGDLYVGDGGAGTLAITNGGAVSNAAGFVGAQAGSTGAVTVDGAGSTWTNAGDLRVGGAGDGALTVTNGGAASNATGYVDSPVTGSTGTVLVTGAGSTWTNRGNLYVGNGGLGTVTVGAGGTALDDCAFLGNVAGSTGAVTVAGPQAAWTNDGGISVGVNGRGTLLVQNGGAVTSVDTPDCFGLSVGVNAGSSGDVVVDGGTIQTATVFVGGGGPGTLGVFNGGVVAASAPVTVGALGALQGDGTVRAPRVLNRGVVAPQTAGGAPATLTVDGDYAQASTGDLNLLVGSPTRFSVLRVTGTADLDGLLTLTPYQGFRPQNGETFAAIAGSSAVRGNFAAINGGLQPPPGSTILITRSPNGVLYTYIPAASVPAGTPTIPVLTSPSGSPGTPGTPGVGGFPGTPTSPGTPANPGSPSSPSGNGTVVVVDVPTAIPALGPGQAFTPSLLLSVLAPGVAAYTSIFEQGFSVAGIGRLQFENRVDELRAVAPEPPPVWGGAPDAQGVVDGKGGKAVLAPPAPARGPRGSVWANGYGDFVKVDDDGAVGGYHVTSGGASLGVDCRLNDRVAVGLLGGYHHAWNDFRPGGSIESNGGEGGLYAAYFDRGFYVSAAGVGGYTEYDLGRQGILGRATGHTQSEHFSLYGGTGDDLRLAAVPNLTVTPFASLQYANVHLDGFDEKGSALPVKVFDDSEESLKSDLGVRLAYRCRLGRVALEPYAKASWEHEYKYSALPVTAAFNDRAGNAGTLRGPRLGHDAALVSAGLAVRLSDRLSTYVGYDGELGRDRYEAHAVNGGVTFAF